VQPPELPAQAASSAVLAVGRGRIKPPADDEDTEASTATCGFSETSSVSTNPSVAVPGRLKGTSKARSACFFDFDDLDQAEEAAAQAAC